MNVIVTGDWGMRSISHDYSVIIKRWLIRQKMRRMKPHMVGNAIIENL